MSHFRSFQRFLLLLALPVVGWCAEPRFAAPVEPAVQSAGGGMVRVFLALGLILALIFAAAWLLRRVRVMQGSGGANIQVLSQVSLGARERAVLVRVAGRELLLGVAPGNVRTLLLLDQTLGTARVADESPAAAAELPPRFDFREILKRSLGK